MVGLQVDPNVLADDLPIGQQQLVEIAKALSVNSRILIMDEPTSSLSQGEVDRLFEVIGQLRESGVSVIYISHRLGEVKILADRVSVLRDGENAGVLDREDISHDRMVQMMVGRDVSQYYSHTPHQTDEVVMDVENLRTAAFPAHELSFQVRRGEILGISGVVGAGRTEMLQAIFGSVAKLAGTVRISGAEIGGQTPVDAIAAGIALVPEDRKLHGLIVDMTVRQNMSLPGLRQNRVGQAFINFSVEDSVTTDMISRLGIKTPHKDQVSRYLSGGNQQKVVLGKWLSLKPSVLLLDEPTRGIDVGAKQEIYQLMEELASNGMAILFVSSELEEILGMSDRVLVMHEGRISGELAREELSEEAIMHLATST
jgi:ribose transport system ATP-binding protein